MESYALKNTVQTTRAARLIVAAAEERPSRSLQTASGHDAVVLEALDPVTGLAVRIKVSPLPPRSGGAVRWAFSVTNRGDEARALMFPSGQEGDVVLEADGVERYRWSRHKAFVLMISERELKASETWSFSLEDVLAVEPGRYSLVASVTATPLPPVVRAELSVD